MTISTSHNALAYEHARQTLLSVFFAPRTTPCRLFSTARSSSLSLYTSVSNPFCTLRLLLTCAYVLNLSTWVPLSIHFLSSQSRLRGSMINYSTTLSTSVSDLRFESWYIAVIRFSALSDLITPTSGLTLHRCHSLTRQPRISRRESVAAATYA